MKNVYRLIGLVVGTELVGIVGGLVTAGGVRDWYMTLNRPWFTPPGWVFGPVWTTLYLLMAVAVFLVWKKKRARMIYAIQLGLNFIWSIIFFGLRIPLLALVDIGFLWVAIGVMYFEFRKTDARAGWLLIPYWGWVSLATLLNAGVVWLNR